MDNILKDKIEEIHYLELHLDVSKPSEPVIGGIKESSSKLLELVEDVAWAFSNWMEDNCGFDRLKDKWVYFKEADHIFYTQKELFQYFITNIYK